MLQVESITFGWCSRDQSLTYIQQALRGEFDANDFAARYSHGCRRPKNTAAVATARDGSWGCSSPSLHITSAPSAMAPAGHRITNAILGDPLHEYRFYNNRLQAVVRPSTSPSQRLRTTMAAARVSLSWFRAQNADRRQKAQAATRSAPKGHFFRRQEVLDTRHPAYKAVTAVRTRAEYWKELSCPIRSPACGSSVRTRSLR